ncbi:hypothetical protein [Bradyrhizobium sp.]|uniref:hypothetical protein n=1 Tax=Bradyrhizobium sp. TaxID=376 RepID=UPI004037C3FF
MPRQGLIAERLIGLFLFGLVLLTPPLIGAFDKATFMGRIPPLYLYLFLSWALLIALTALIVERPDPDEESAGSDPGPNPDRRPDRRPRA